MPRTAPRLRTDTAIARLRIAAGLTQAAAAELADSYMAGCQLRRWQEIEYENQPCPPALRQELERRAARREAATKGGRARAARARRARQLAAKEAARLHR